MKKENRFILIFAGLLILLTVLVLAADPTFNESAYNVSYYFSEDNIYYHNFTVNLTDFSQLSHFSILDIEWSENSSLTSHSDFYWLPWNDSGFSNSTTGVLKINSTSNNETGNFTINVHAQGSVTGHSAKFEFIINATNDNPEFTNINNTYNLTQDVNFFTYLNASDEEEHYPLFFNISFFNNCSLASWSTRGAGNCSLFSLTNIVNTSASINFTPLRNDAGTYWANVSVRDDGNNSLCPHEYCDNTTYQQNKTSYQTVEFEVFSVLNINITNCQNKIFQENETGTCEINITTKGTDDSLNISSYAILRNYATGQSDVSNTSWFYVNSSETTVNFTKTITINVTPQRTEVGNWTINFTVKDLTFGENETSQIYVYVNRTYNDAPDLASINNLNTSILLQTRINLTVYDDDSLIPDKNESFGGYNETINFTVQIFNQSNLSQELSLNGFDVEILNMPVAGTNRTEAKIEFTPNSSEAGNYTINISINDKENSLDYETFNLTIIDNNFPYWNQPLRTNFVNFEDTERYLNLSLNVTDPDGDTLTFSFTNDTAFPSFNLNATTGVINFTGIDEDVGQNLVNITISDGYLTNSTLFSFTILNINDAPVILDLDTVNATPSTITDGSSVNATEDNYTTFILWIEDDDLKIPTGQKNYYNESFTINLTIEGPNSTLFNFTIDDGWWPQPAKVPGSPNKTKYEATFTPRKADSGDYNISINVTDSSDSSDTHSFNLTVLEINHNPILMNLTNQSSAVNRSFYYRINATDQEDGNSNVTGGNTNLTFSYNFLSGTDFINNNQSIFNLTTGELNITFNSTHSGQYHINITVNDSQNLNDSDDFWLSVYDSPNVTFPVSGENFSLQENVTSNLTFQANHSVGDNLTYLFYIDNVLKDNLSYYGNGTNLTWQLTPNFTDETYGQSKNLTLVVYPANNGLENRNNLNKTLNWNINISHTNSPVTFSGTIGSAQTTYNDDITINLTTYFSDIDYSDTNYNQTVNFSVASNSSPSFITSSVSNWTLTLSSLIAIAEIINITGNDSLSSVTSNNFEIKFTTPPAAPAPMPSSGGGGATITVSLKVIVPDPFTIFQKDRVVVPITLYNDGQRSLLNIGLTSTVTKDNLVTSDMRVSFDKSSFSLLGAGQKENVTLTIDVDTTQIGMFEITIDANVSNPKYHALGKLFLTVGEGEGLLDRLLFIEKFITENAECAEFTEIVNEARNYFEKKDFNNAELKMNQALDVCKNTISQSVMVSVRKNIEENLYRYLFIGMSISFLSGISYYIYKRIKLRRVSKKNLKLKPAEFVKAPLAIGIGIVGFFVVKPKITGFAVNSSNFILKDLSIGFAFLIGVFVIFIFLYRKNIKRMVENKKRKNCNKNSLKELIKKKVYTDSGDYVGKIEGVILGKNKIANLKIKLDSKVKKRKKIKAKGIIVKYKQVESVGHILIIKGGILKLKRNL